MVSRRLTAILAAIALCITGTALAPAGASAQDPILFVHGYVESASLWNTMIANFEKDGYPKSYLSAYSYNTSQSNKVDAEEVKTKVEALLKSTGATKVDIVAHSMGSLNSRWYIKFLGGETKVDDWVSLGGPNHGTEKDCVVDCARIEGVHRHVSTHLNQFDVQMFFFEKALLKSNPGDGKCPTGIRYRDAYCVICICWQHEADNQKTND